MSEIGIPTSGADKLFEFICYIIKVIGSNTAVAMQELQIRLAMSRRQLDVVVGGFICKE
jgi:hypothetical protein